MYEVIENVLKTRRSEERYIPLLGLVKILDLMSYQDSLISATSLSHAETNSDNLLADIERLIIENSVHLLRRLGITIDPIVNKQVDFLYALLNWIVVDLDQSENIDEILDILDSDEPTVIKLADITSLFSGLNHVDDISLIEFVEERFFNLVYNNINSRKEAEQAKVSQFTPQDKRVHKFLGTLSRDDLVWAEFETGNYKKPRNEFLEELADLGVLDFDNRMEYYIKLIAGIQLAYADNYEDAIDVVDLVVLLIADIDIGMSMRIASSARKLITTDYYEVTK